MNKSDAKFVQRLFVAAARDAGYQLTRAVDASETMEPSGALFPVYVVLAAASPNDYEVTLYVSAPVAEAAELPGWRADDVTPVIACKNFNLSAYFVEKILVTLRAAKAAQMAQAASEIAAARAEARAR
jgi:hypothetical protein